MLSNKSMVYCMRSLLMIYSTSISQYLVLSKHTQQFEKPESQCQWSTIIIIYYWPLLEICMYQHWQYPPFWVGMYCVVIYLNLYVMTVDAIAICTSTLQTFRSLIWLFSFPKWPRLWHFEHEGFSISLAKVSGNLCRLGIKM